MNLSNKEQTANGHEKALLEIWMKLTLYLLKKQTSRDVTIKLTQIQWTNWYDVKEAET